MNKKIRSDTNEQSVFYELQYNSYLAVLLKIRNITDICCLDEMTNPKYRDLVKKAVSTLNVDDFTIRQWRIAAYYLIGEKIEIYNAKQAFDMIIHEFSKKE